MHICEEVLQGNYLRILIREIIYYEKDFNNYYYINTHFNRGVFKVYTVLDVSEDVSPITLVKSIFELEKNNKLIYEMSSSPLKFISKENFDIISYMDKNSFELVDQLGSIYIFKNNNEQRIFKSYKITKKYIFLEEINEKM